MTHVTIHPKFLVGWKMPIYRQIYEMSMSYVTIHPKFLVGQKNVSVALWLLVDFKSRGPLA